ncbi:MAG: class I SAM-dependent RNA methyltransferase [Lachnospiraceae bacterium]|nr:class I SAM-dependent RNA methyltransferase [Lachnospiraceae bacterium]
MKKGEIYEGIVNRIDFPNKGIVTIEGREVTVKNALPGQTVRFVINKKRGGRLEGRLLEVVRRADYETEPDCPHYPECGGCLYRTVKYEDQLRIKEDQLRRLFFSNKTGDGSLSYGPSLIFEGIKPSPAFNEYRNKMEFSFGDEYKDGPLTLGLHKRGGFYDIVNVSQCRIVDEDYRKILSAVQDHFRGTGLTFYKKMQHTGYLRHLVVRKAAGTGEILVNLVTTSRGETDDKTGDDKTGDGSVSCGEGIIREDVDISGQDIEPSPVLSLSDREPSPVLSLAEVLKGLDLEGTLVGVLHTINDSLSDVVASDETRILYGRDYFYENLLGLKFKISPFSFFQTNSRGAEVLYETAREYILSRGEQDREPSPVLSDVVRPVLSTEDRSLSCDVIFDLYSGTGTIAQMISPAAGKVIGVEIVEEAVEAARENARLNGIDNCAFIAGDVLKVIDEIEEKPDFIILDPPRDGVHPKALTKLLERYKGRYILYISCKPTSLVRDMEVLKDYGYKPVRMCAVDMFPGTPNIEVISLFMLQE